MPEQELKLGLYKHYKGGTYFVAKIGVLEKTMEPVAIYYRCMPDFDGTYFVRPVKEFFEIVEGERPRFVYIPEVEATLTA